VIFYSPELDELIVIQSDVFATKIFTSKHSLILSELILAEYALYYVELL
jgi:hypothetical protein